MKIFIAHIHSFFWHLFIGTFKGYCEVTTRTKSGELVWLASVDTSSAGQFGGYKIVKVFYEEPK